MPVDASLGFRPGVFDLHCFGILHHCVFVPSHPFPRQALAFRDLPGRHFQDDEGAVFFRENNPGRRREAVPHVRLYEIFLHA